MPEPDRALALAQERERRLDQRTAQSVARDQRPAGASAGGKRLAHHRARKPGRARRRLDVERSEQKRPHQPLVERAAEAHDLADRAIAFGPQQPRERQVFGGAGAGHPPARSKIHQGRAAVVDAQRPLLAWWRDRRTDSRQLAGRPVSPRRSAAESAAPRDCPTAPDGCRCRWSCRAWRRDSCGSARRRRHRLVHDDPLAAHRELDRGRQAGKPGADDVDGPRHQMIA